MIRPIAALAAGAALLAACGASDAPADAQAEAETQAAAAPESVPFTTPNGLEVTYTQALHDDPPYQLEHDMLWLMENVVQPAADVFWGSAGWVIDAEGEHDLSPTTDEGWANVVTHAAIVAELGNLMKTPIYSEDKGDDWMQYSGALTDIGMQAQQAAEDRDIDAIFDVGETMDRICEACHIAYNPAMSPDYVYPGD